MVLALTGCTRVIDAAPAKAPPQPAPITAGQVSDLLSEQAVPDPDPNLFVTVKPEKCAALAQEVDPPFLFDITPAAHDGGQYFDQPDEEFSIVEMVAVYGADYDAPAAVAHVESTIEDCRNDRFTATAMEGDVIDFHVVQQRKSSPNPEIALWSTDGDWSCDNAFVAAHNAAIELTACSDHNGFDILPVAQEALKRIEALANMTA